MRTITALAAGFLLLQGNSIAQRAGSAEASEPSPAQRIQALERQVPAQSIPQLLTLATDPKPSTRESARRALARLAPKAPTPLREALTASDPAIRREAATALASSLDLSAMFALAGALGDSSTEVKERAAWGLSRLLDPVLKALIADLDAPDSRTRKASASEISRFWGEVVTPLTRALADSSGAVRRRAVEALGELGGRVALSWIPIVAEEEVKVKAQANILELKARPVPAVTGALKDSAPEVRAAAALALAKFRAEKAADHVATLTQDPNRDVRWSAARALGDLGAPDAGGAVATLLGDRSPLVRAKAAWALGKLGAKEHASKVAVLLKDPDRFVRREAAIVLGGLGSAAALPALTGAIDDADPLVREFSARSLGELKDPAAFPALEKAARDSNPLVRRSAIQAFGDLQVSQTVVLLARALDDPDRLTRRLAVQSLEQLRTAGAIPGLAKALTHRDRDLRQQAVEALGRLGFPEGAGPLLSALKDPDAEVRRAAALAIKRSRPEGAVEPLLETAKKERGPVRLAAIDALGRYPDDRVVAYLAGLFSAPDCLVRALAFAGLDNLDAPKPEGVLLAELRHSDPAVRRKGIEYVVCINPRGAQDVLKTMAANDPDPRVRKAAARAIKKLEVPKH
jgi:HEAT repeat protein